MDKRVLLLQMADLQLYASNLLKIRACHLCLKEKKFFFLFKICVVADT